MKRIPLKQLRKILKVGDYVGVTPDTLNRVQEIDQNTFSYCAHFYRVVVEWAGRQTVNGSDFVPAHKTYHWLPSELLDAPFTDPIKRARLKEAKEE